jgi:hypothetical protein
MANAVNGGNFTFDQAHNDQTLNVKKVEEPKNGESTVGKAVPGKGIPQTITQGGAMSEAERASAINGGNFKPAADNNAKSEEDVTLQTISVGGTISAEDMASAVKGGNFTFDKDHQDISFTQK